VIDKRNNKQGEIPDIPPYFTRPFVAVKFNESLSSCPKGKSTIAFKCLLQRRYSKNKKVSPVPEGRGERCGQYMIRVAVFPEQTDIFLSEALCTVMFFLVGNVSNCVSQLRNANAESTITRPASQMP
jgi:hypothetical protein